jgi:NitT/TauT family transport system permease protein
VKFRDVITPNGPTTSRVRSALLVVTLITVLAVWACRPAFLPGPLEVIHALGRLIGEGLAYQIYVSLTTNLQAIALSCAISLPLAYLTVLPAARPFVRILSKIRFLGLTGLVVIFTITFGGGHALKLAILVFGMTVFLLTSLYDLIEIIPREEFDYARSLRFGPWRTVYEVVILGRLDAVFDAVRQNAAMGWVLLTMVEGLVRFEGGLGALMLAEDKHLHLDTVFALQFVVLAIGIAQDASFVWLRHIVCPYADLTLERK